MTAKHHFIKRYLTLYQKFWREKKCMKLSILMSEKEKEGYIDMIVNGKFLLARAQ